MNSEVLIGVRRPIAVAISNPFSCSSAPPSRRLSVIGINTLFSAEQQPKRHSQCPVCRSQSPIQPVKISRRSIRQAEFQILVEFLRIPRNET